MSYKKSAIFYTTFILVLQKLLYLEIVNLKTLNINYDLYKNKNIYFLKNTKKCFYTKQLLKLNCSFLVAIHNMSLQTTFGKGGGSSSELYNNN